MLQRQPSQRGQGSAGVGGGMVRRRNSQTVTPRPGLGNRQPFGFNSAPAPLQPSRSSATQSLALQPPTIGPQRSMSGPSQSMGSYAPLPPRQSFTGNVNSNSPAFPAPPRPPISRGGTFVNNDSASNAPSRVASYQTLAQMEAASIRKADKRGLESANIRDALYRQHSQSGGVLSSGNTLPSGKSVYTPSAQAPTAGMYQPPWSPAPSNNFSRERSPGAPISPLAPRPLTLNRSNTTGAKPYQTLAQMESAPRKAADRQGIESANIRDALFRQHSQKSGLSVPSNSSIARRNAMFAPGEDPMLNPK